jgi:hypothetical protein
MDFQNQGSRLKFDSWKTIHDKLRKTTIKIWATAQSTFIVLLKITAASALSILDYEISIQNTFHIGFSQRGRIGGRGKMYIKVHVTLIALIMKLQD